VAATSTDLTADATEEAGAGSAKKRRPRFQMQPGWVVQAYRFALDPNAPQLPLLHSHAGAARAAYNWAVARVSGNWEQRAAEEFHGLTGDELTP
jgi:putative transposase